MPPAAGHFTVLREDSLRLLLIVILIIKYYLRALKNTAFLLFFYLWTGTKIVIIKVLRLEFNLWKGLEIVGIGVAADH